MQVFRTFLILSYLLVVKSAMFAPKLHFDKLDTSIKKHHNNKNKHRCSIGEGGFFFGGGACIEDQSRRVYGWDISLNFNSSLFTCHSKFPSFYLSFCVLLYLSVHLSIYLFIACIPVFLCGRVFIYFFPSICFISVFITYNFWLSVCLSVSHFDVNRTQQQLFYSM
jgi:hypothetical protein